MSKFKFEEITKAERTTADVSIYKNGMVRFSRKAIETYGISDTDILWGENDEKTVLAMRKVSCGRVLRGKRMDITSCATKIAERYVGKYFIKQDGEILILMKNPAKGELK